MLRPPLDQDRLALLDDGLVRITLKRAFNDGTFAIDRYPLSVLGRGRGGGRAIRPRHEDHSRFVTELLTRALVVWFSLARGLCSSKNAALLEPQFQLARLLLLRHPEARSNG